MHVKAQGFSKFGRRRSLHPEPAPLPSLVTRARSPQSVSSLVGRWCHIHNPTSSNTPATPLFEACLSVDPLEVPALHHRPTLFLTPLSLSPQQKYLLAPATSSHPGNNNVRRRCNSERAALRILPSQQHYSTQRPPFPTASLLGRFQNRRLPQHNHRQPRSQRLAHCLQVRRL